MAQKPLEEMADVGYENMSEESGYVLYEFKQFARAVTSQLEAKVDNSNYRSDIQVLGDRIESAATMADLSAIWKSAENIFADKREFLAIADMVSDLSELRYCVDDLKSSVNIISDNNNWIESTTNVSSVQLLALNASPVTLAPTPGPGKFIVVSNIQVFYDYESSAYTVGASNDLSVEYSSGGQLMQVEATGLLDQTSDQRRFKAASGEVIPADDQAVVLKMLSSEVTSGDSPIKVKVCYRIIDLIT